MIRIQTIFDRVADLSRKDKAGYNDADEFNRNMVEAQSLLMDYHYMRFEEMQMTLDALNPFIKEVRLPIDNQFCNLPDDYRHKLEGGYALTTNTSNDKCVVGQPNVDFMDAQHLKQNEVLKTLSSAIRKPKMASNGRKGKYAYTFVNNRIKVFPKELQGYWYFKYITDPPLATYAVNIDVANAEEDYDDLNSVNLLWNEQDQPNLVDLMLFFKGIQIRENTLLQWVQQKEAYTKRQI